MLTTEVTMTVEQSQMGPIWKCTESETS